MLVQHGIILKATFARCLLLAYLRARKRISWGYPIDNFYVYGWSISGNETAIGVKTRGMFFMFDVGIVPSWSVNAEHVFISHGHIDHIGAICQHMRKRTLKGLPPAVYYLLPHLIEPVKSLCHTYSQLHGEDTDLARPHLMEVLPGSPIRINNKWVVESFPTNHVVQSQGYTLFHKDYGTDEYLPEIAYTGDTRFSIYTEPAHRDLLRVRLLITEATYLEDNLRMKKNAEKYGHICIDEYATHSSLFRDVASLFLVHFSDRYSVSAIQDRVYGYLPPELRNKVFCSLTAKKANSIDHSAPPQQLY